jgi:hypothetical protein
LVASTLVNRMVSLGSSAISVSAPDCETPPNSAAQLAKSSLFR